MAESGPILATWAGRTRQEVTGACDNRPVGTRLRDMNTPINDSLHAALDGDTSRDDLSPAERDALDELNAQFAGVLRAAAPASLAPQAAHVLARINDRRATADASRPPLTNRLLGWLWSPARVSISLRPAYALAFAFAGACAVIVAISARPRGGPGAKTAVASAASQPVLVQFRFEAPRASAVSLAGDFTNWAPTYSLQRSAGGTWTIVVPLAPGVHDYSFIVDGTRWTPDPAAPARADGFGGTDSRIAVLASDAVKTL